MKRDWLGRKLLAERLNFPLWITKRWDDQYVSSLIETQAKFDPIVDRQAKRILFALHLRQALQPYLRIFTVLGSVVHGLYRKAAEKICGRAIEEPSSGPVGTGISQQTWASPSVAPATAATNSAVEDAGIRTGEVVAYRCWILRDDGFLHSVYRSDFVWKPGEVVTGNPDDDGEGIHAFKTRNDACTYLRYDENRDAKLVVSGTVYLWGKIFEHESGYRAENAAIKSIDDSPYYDAESLKKLYKLNRKRRKRRKRRK